MDFDPTKLRIAIFHSRTYGNDAIEVELWYDGEKISSDSIYTPDPPSHDEFDY